MNETPKPCKQIGETRTQRIRYFASTSIIDGTNREHYKFSQNFFVYLVTDLDYTGYKSFSKSQKEDVVSSSSMKESNNIDNLSYINLMCHSRPSRTM